MEATFTIQCNHCKEWVEVGGGRGKKLSPSCERFLNWLKYGHLALTLLFAIYVAFSFAKWETRLGDIDCSYIGICCTTLLILSAYALLHAAVFVCHKQLTEKWCYTPRALHEETEEDTSKSKKEVSFGKVLLLLAVDALLMFGPNYNECELARKECSSCRAHPKQHYGCDRYDARREICPEWMNGKNK